MSFSFDGAYLIRSWKLYKAVQAFQLWRKPIFFRNESKFLQQPRHEQEQLDFSQWFASTEPSARSEWEIVTLAGDQVSFVVKVTVRVELSRVLPAFGIQVNWLYVRKHYRTFRDTVAAESCVIQGGMGRCKRSHVSNTKRFYNGSLDEGQIGSIIQRQRSVTNYLI